MLLSIIIVSYNTEKLTLAAIKSAAEDIARSKRLADDSEILVVDNNSRDGSLKALQQLTKEISNLSIIANQENSGFAQANNQGIEKSKGQYLLLLNSDTLVQPGALEAMISTFENNPIQDLTAHSRQYHGQLDRLGILSATLFNPDGSFQPQGGSFPTLLSLGVHMLMLDDLPLIGQYLPSTQHTGRRAEQLKQNQASDSQKVAQQEWVNGAALMIRREVIAEIGLLDEQIFMYGEDIEYCLRAQNHHWDVAVDRTAEIIHIGSASSSSDRAILGELRGYLYIWSKHKPLWQMPFVRFMINLGCRARIFIFGTILRNSARAEVYREALETI